MTDFIEKLSDRQYTGLSRLFLVIGIILLVFLASAMTGCGKTNPVKPPPALAQCDTKCYEPCAKDGDTGVRWEGDPKAAATIDALGEAVIPALTGKLLACDVNRQACVQCLNRLETNKVIIQ